MAGEFDDILASLHYDSFDVKTNLMPYDDLGASGNFPNLRKVPDDVMDFLVHLSAQGPSYPKLLRTDADGNLYVNDVSGGGGGGVSPVQTLQQRGVLAIPYSNSTFFQDNALPLPCTLYRVTISACLDLDTTSTGDSGPVSLSFTDVLFGTEFLLFEYEQVILPTTSAGYNPMLYLNLEFNPPRIMGPQWPGASSVGLQSRGFSDMNFVFNTVSEFTQP